MATKTIQANGGHQVKPKRLIFGSPFASFYNHSNGYGDDNLETAKNGKFAEETTNGGGALASLRKKLGEQQHSYVGALLLVLVLSFILSRMAVFMGLDNVSLKDIFVSSYAAAETAAQNVWTSSLNNINGMKFELEFSSLMYATVVGLIVAAFSWTMVYLDSDVPGENPPTPFSPRRNQSYQRHLTSSYSLGYIMTIVNGIAAAVYLLIR